MAHTYQDRCTKPRVRKRENQRQEFIQVQSSRGLTSNCSKTLKKNIPLLETQYNRYAHAIP